MRRCAHSVGRALLFTWERKMRVGWDEYFMQIAESTAARASCPRAGVGAVIVNEHKEIVSTGYNGAPKKSPNCLDVGCQMHEGHCIRAEHAERNAIYQAAASGKGCRDSVIYVTHFPCFECARAIIQAGITKVFYRTMYRDGSVATAMLNTASVSILHLEKRI